MLDAQLVSAALASREAYDSVREHITERDLSPPAAFWWKLIGEWYGRDNSALRVDTVALGSLGDSRITSPKQRDTLVSFFSGLPESVSPANTAQVALEIKRHNVGLELAAAIAAQDGKKISKLHALYGELMQATGLTGRRPQWQDAVGIDELFTQVGDSRRVPLAPASLNSRIAGGALPGHHVIAFGRPEIGKSTFAVNLAAVTAAKGQRVLYVGNEDQIDILKARAVSRVAGMTWEEAQREPEKAKRLWKKADMEERLHFSQLHHGSVESLRAKVEEVKPTILVLDQIRNLESREDGMVHKLEANGQLVREILLEYGLIGVSITQAWGGAEGRVWLDTTDIDNSKTGLPGTADLLIGIGGDDALRSRNQRALSFPKNKLSSAANSHEGLIVEYDTSRSKVT